MPGFREWSLKTKFALGTGLLIGLFSFLFTGWTVRQVSIEERANVVDAQRALVRATAAELEERIEQRRDAMTTIAALVPTPTPTSAKQWDDFFAPRPVIKKMFDTVTVVDPTGQILYSLPDNAAFPDPNPGERDYFRSVLAGSPLVVSVPLRASPGSEPYLVFAAPLRSRSGQVLGALLGTLRLGHPNFLSSLGGVHIGKDGFFALVDTRGETSIVMVPDEDRIATPGAGGRANPIIRRAATEGEGTLEGLSTRGIESLRTFSALHAAPWVLVAVYPTTEAFAGLRSRKREAMWVGGALFLAGSAMAWAMTLWLLRPLTRLRQDMESHAEGLPVERNPSAYGSSELTAVANAYHDQAVRRRQVEDRLRASQERLRRIADNIPVFIAHIDTQWRYTFANAEYGRVFGDDPKDMIGKTMQELRGEGLHGEIEPWMRRALAGEAVRFERTNMINGEQHIFQLDYVPDVDQSGAVNGVYVLKLDITAARRAEAMHVQSEQRLRAITDNLPVLITYVDREERLRFLNATFGEWYGVNREQAVGRTVLELIGQRDYDALYRDRIARCLSGERVAFEIESKTRMGNKILYIVYIPDVQPDGSVAGFYTLTSDVTEIKNAQRQLDALVRADTLTGLPNRFQFNEVLPQAMKRSKASGLGLGLMFLDIDHFKAINDGFGHATGDAVLREFAVRLRRAVRATDFVARLAGDEFVVVLEDLHHAEEPAAIAQKILAEIDSPFVLGDRSHVITTSVGVLFESEVATTPSDLLARADAALYQAKAAGRNRYQLFEVSEG